MFEIAYDLTVSTHTVDPELLKEFDEVRDTYSWNKFPQDSCIIVVDHDEDQIKAMCDDGNVVYSWTHSDPIEGLDHYEYLGYTIYETEIEGLEDCSGEETDDAN